MAASSSAKGVDTRSIGIHARVSARRFPDTARSITPPPARSATSWGCRGYEDKQERWKSEPVYEFSADLFGGPDPQGEKVYTISQAAEATGLSEKLIRDEIKADAIPIVGLPGERRTMVRRQDLNGYIRMRVIRRANDEEED